MYRQALGAEIESLLASLAADLPPSEFLDGTLDWLRRHYRPTATMAGSFAGALAELLVAGAQTASTVRTGSQAERRAASGARIRPGPRVDHDLERQAEELQMGAKLGSDRGRWGDSWSCPRGSRGATGWYVSNGSFMPAGGGSDLTLANCSALRL